MFWLYAEPEVLNARLDARVDKMLEASRRPLASNSLKILTLILMKLGLLEEIESLWSTPAVGGDGEETAVDYSRGVYQAIGEHFITNMTQSNPDPVSTGYKEFEPFLSQRATRPLDADPSAAPDPLFLEGLERMKLSTRQYAKKQVKWVKQNLVPAASASLDGDVFVYLLDATGASS